jgi:hypothetical protein
VLIKVESRFEDAKEGGEMGETILMDGLQLRQSRVKEVKLSKEAK